MACSSSCLTKDHASYGDCLRAKNLRIAYCGQGGGDATAQKRFDYELQAYRDARAQGIQPAGTQLHQVRAAVEESNKTGIAVQAA